MDQLRFANNDSIKKLLSPDERVVFKEKLGKFNSYRALIERNLLITSKAIYILKNETVEGKIVLNKLKGVTRDKQETSIEFIIHVEGADDCHFKTKLRNQIISILQALYLEQFNKDLRLYEVPNYLLADYVTAEEDVAENISRLPEESFLVLNDNEEIKANESRF